MTPALARLKQAARTAVEMCGGVDGAAATTGRGRSTCGRWMNRNDGDMPTLDSALALDGVAVARGDAPPITSALACELGGVLVFPIAAPMTDADWHRLAAQLSDDHADLLGGLLRDIADHKIQPHEAARRLTDADTLLTVVVEVRQRLRAIAEGRE